LTLSQSCRKPPGKDPKDPEPFHIPVKVGLLDAATGAEALPTQLLELKESEQTFVLDGVKKGVTDVIPSILRGFSAPVRLEREEPLSDESLAFLMEYDTDPFNKWEASQLLAKKVLLESTEAFKASPDAAPELDDTFLKAFRGSLTETIGGLDGSGAKVLDLNLAAYALTLPSLSELLDSAEVPVDPLAIVAARKHVKQTLAAAAKTQLEKVYHLTAPEDGAPFSVDGAEVGRRALRNLCLDYLSSIEGSARPMKQFEAASCMTDKLAALGALVNQDPSAERTSALELFKSDAGADALVVNKWFSVQAASGSLDEVEALLGHPDFSWTNPNRLRSVVSVFSAVNLKAFHASDGSGYALVGDAVLRVDKTNNQIAARMTGAFSLWRKYDDERGALMRAQLERIRDSEGVSKDVYEIASKSLA